MNNMDKDDSIYTRTRSKRKINTERQDKTNKKQKLNKGNPKNVGEYVPNFYTSDDENGINKFLFNKDIGSDDIDEQVRDDIINNVKDMKVDNDSSNDSVSYDFEIAQDKLDNKNYNIDEDYDPSYTCSSSDEYSDEGPEFYNKINKLLDKRDAEEKGIELDDDPFVNLMTGLLGAQKNMEKFNKEELDDDVLNEYSKAEKDKLNTQYKKIKKSIDKVPKIMDILKVNASFKQKCSLMQDLQVLHNLEPFTPEYVLQRNDLIEKMDNYNKEKESAEEQEELEKELIDAYQGKESLKSQILKSKFDTDTRAIIYGKYLQMKEMDSSDTEYHKLKDWLEQALKIPTESTIVNLPSKNDDNETINSTLSGIQCLLDKELYGMDNVKEEILLLLCNKITNNASIGNSLALLGPPGTGKTCIIKTLAKALNIPFTQISVGGTKDSSFLDGHSYTYVGATPGMIAKSLMKMKCNNGIIFFDEIDKLSDSEQGKEVAWNLLHITDFSQNNEFRDKYLMDIPIDLSKTWFIYSMNDDTNMDSALRDRMPVIKVKGYNSAEKVKIAEQYMIPKIIKNLGMLDTDVTYSQQVLEYIISKSVKNGSDELGGVRDLDKLLYRIFRKINLYKCSVLDGGHIGNLRLTYKIDNFVIPLDLTKDIVDNLTRGYGSESKSQLNMYF